MASEQKLGIPPATFNASADLSSSNGLCASFDASGNIAVSGAGADGPGIIDYYDTSADAAGKAVALNVVSGQIVKAVAGAAFNENDMLVADAAGKLVAASADTQYRRARAVQAAAGANEVVRVQIVHGDRPATV